MNDDSIIIIVVLTQVSNCCSAISQIKEGNFYKELNLMSFACNFEFEENLVTRLYVKEYSKSLFESK